MDARPQEPAVRRQDDDRGRAPLNSKTVIDDLRTRIVDANPATPGVDELKEWQALIGFISMLPDTGGNTIPNIPATNGAPAAPRRIVITP